MSDVTETAVAAGVMTDDHPSRYIHPDAPVWLLPKDRIIWSQGYLAAALAKPAPEPAGGGVEAVREALAEAIEFAEQDFHALTPAGEAMVERWRAVLPAAPALENSPAGLADAHYKDTPATENEERR